MVRRGLAAEISLSGTAIAGLSSLADDLPRGVEDDAGPAAPAMLPRDLSLFVGDREIAELMQLEITAEDLAVRRHNIARLRTFRQS